MKNAYRITRDGRVVCEVAGRVSSATVKRIARAITKNPTLVHHGLAKGAAYHLTSTLSGPVADVYVAIPMLARSVAQLVSNALNETVEVTKNTLAGKGSVHSRAGTRRPGGRGRLGIPSRNPAGDPRVGETWTEFTSGAKFRVVSVGASDITALNLETGNRVRIGRTEFAATMRAPRTRTNPVDDDPRQFSVGDEVSISAMPYFGRHGVVVAVGTKLVSVRVNLIDRVVKFRAGDLRLVNPSRSKSAQTKRKMFRRTYRGSRSRKAAKGAQLKKFAWLADQRSERIARRALRGNPEPRLPGAAFCRAWVDGKGLGAAMTAARAPVQNPGVRIVYNKLLGGWYVVTGPHQTPLNGRFNSKAEAQVWLDGRRTRNPKGRLPGNVEIVEALGGGWMVLVNGFQWGRGEPDPSGAYDDVFPTKAAATAAYLEAHPKRNPKGRKRPRGARRNPHGQDVVDAAAQVVHEAGWHGFADDIRAGRMTPEHGLRVVAKHGTAAQRAIAEKALRALAGHGYRTRRTPNPARYVVRAARGYVYGLRRGRPGEWSYDWTTHHRNAYPMTKGMAESLAKAVGGEAIRVTLDRDGRPQGPIPNPKGRKQSRSRRRGGRARRTRNPSSELERAKRTALMWNEFPATGSRRVKVRSLRIPKHLVKLGDLDSVVYRSKKYGGKPKLYEHRFKRPLPVLTSDPDGRSMHIVGGGYTITGDGLVN